MKQRLFIAAILLASLFSAGKVVKAETEKTATTLKPEDLAGVEVGRMELVLRKLHLTPLPATATEASKELAKEGKTVWPFGKLDEEHYIGCAITDKGGHIVQITYKPFAGMTEKDFNRLNAQKGYDMAKRVKFNAEWLNDGRWHWISTEGKITVFSQFRGSILDPNIHRQDVTIVDGQVSGVSDWH